MPDLWSSYLPQMGAGMILTLQILVVTIPVSILLGLLLGSLRVYGGRGTSLAATGFSSVFRGFPLIVTLLLFFFGLPEVGIYFSPYWTAVLAFIFCSGAYQSEYIKGAIRSIDAGQVLAARSLGMGKWQQLWNVVLPQAFRRALPSISNEIIYQVKYSCFAFIIGVEEIMGTAQTFEANYVQPMAIFGTAAVVYLIMNAVATIAFRYTESRLSIPGLEIEH